MNDIATPNHIAVTIMVPDDRVRSLLCCAFEGGSNYWYHGLHHELAPGLEIGDFHPGGARNPNRPEGRHHDWTWPYVVPFVPGCCLTLGVNDEDGEEGEYHGTTFRLNRDRMAHGLAVMAEKYPRHFADFIREDEDATTGDIFLQCCLFDMAVFG